MKRHAVLLVVALCGALAVGLLTARERQPAPVAAPAVEGGREADADATRKSAEDFARAFEKGDARAAAACWTEGAEYVGHDGATLRGRAEIETAFADLFKDKNRARLEVDVRSIRFPSKDLAIEEGILRHTPDGPGLPSSTLYTTTHVREDGKWLIAHSREWGGDQDRLGDLAFLIGQWEGGPAGEEVRLTLAKESDGPFISGKFTRRVGGKAGPTGTIRIGLDADRGQLRSWHFDADGGQGQCAWLRDGTRWVLDAVGVAGDGTITAGVNVLARLGPDEITWRSIDRVAGGKPLPDTLPVKLMRVPAGK
jgi:uncharacterized protein (TIGR02246 family)